MQADHTLAMHFGLPIEVDFWARVKVKLLVVVPKNVESFHPILLLLLSSELIIMMRQLEARNSLDIFLNLSF